MPNWMRVCVILVLIGGGMYIDSRYGGNWDLLWMLGVLIVVLAIEGRYFVQGRRTRQERE